MNTSTDVSEKTLIQKGFELDKGINRALIVAGLGAMAVGAVIAAPAVVTFGGIVAGGSIAGLEITKRFERGYDKSQVKKKLGTKVTKDNFTVAA